MFFQIFFPLRPLVFNSDEFHFSIDEILKSGDWCGSTCESTLVLQITIIHITFLFSNYRLISMTFERFYSVIRPHKAALFTTVKKAKIIILCIFMGCFLNSIPFLFLGANIGTKCIPIKNASDKLLHELYYWIQEILIFIFPFISLLTMNSE